MPNNVVTFVLDAKNKLKKHNVLLMWKPEKAFPKNDNIFLLKRDRKTMLFWTFSGGSGQTGASLTAPSTGPAAATHTVEQQHKLGSLFNRKFNNNNYGEHKDHQIVI